MQEEIWKDLPIYGKHSKYQVSNMGNMRKVYVRFGEEMETRPLKVSLCRGYPSLTLRNNGKPRLYFVHTLVARAFVENWYGYKYVTHLDGNKENNSASNLVWREKINITEKKYNWIKAVVISNDKRAKVRQVEPGGRIWIDKEDTVYHFCDLDFTQIVD